MAAMMTTSSEPSQRRRLRESGSNVSKLYKGRVFPQDSPRNASGCCVTGLWLHENLQIAWNVVSTQGFARVRRGTACL